MTTRKRTRRPASQVAPETPAAAVPEAAMDSTEPVEPLAIRDLPNPIVEAQEIAEHPVASTYAEKAERRRQHQLVAYQKAPIRTYVVGNRALKMNGTLRMPGEEIPEAKDWPRVESWIAAGRIIPIPA